MPDQEPSRPTPAARFAPARLRAVTLRQEIESTHAQLEATVAALEHDDPPSRSGHHERSRPQLVPQTVAQAGAPAAEPESQPTIASEPVSVPEPEPRPGPAAGATPRRTRSPLATAAITFAAVLGAGLLLRRR